MNLNVLAAADKRDFLLRGDKILLPRAVTLLRWRLATTRPFPPTPAVPTPLKNSYVTMACVASCLRRTRDSLKTYR